MHTVEFSVAGVWVPFGTFAAPAALSGAIFALTSVGYTVRVSDADTLVTAIVNPERKSA